MALRANRACLLRRRLAETPRVGTLIVMPDRLDRRRTTFVPSTDHRFRHQVREIAGVAGLPKDLSFLSFRKGGTTEGGDASATDQELMASGRHKTRATLTVYTSRTSSQAARAARKRRAWRTKDGRGSE